MNKIVTHAGQAHADDLMAVALIMLKEGWKFTDCGCKSCNGVEVVRVNDCKAADFPDAKFIVDIGKEHDSKMGWFDHHQFPKDSPPACAFTLVAAYYGIDRSKMYWIDRLELLDSKGPYVWFRHHYGRRPKNQKELNDALGSIDVFSWFTRIANRGRDNPAAFQEAIVLAMNWLKMELEYHERRPENYAFAKSSLEMIPVGDFKMAFFRQKAMRGINDVLDDVSFDPACIVTGKLDDRGNGFSATKLNDDPRVNFLPRKGEKGCIFAHENGFCLKWEDNWEGFLSAVQRSIQTETIVMRSPAPVSGFSGTQGFPSFGVSGAGCP